MSSSLLEFALACFTSVAPALFVDDELPQPMAGFQQWGELAFAAIRGERMDVIYDAPREQPWRGGHA